MEMKKPTAVRSYLDVGKLVGTRSILDTRVIIEGPENHNHLREGFILWITETRSSLGGVDEIFGPVKCPYYVVRYNSKEKVTAGISVGTTVSYVVELAEIIFKQKDLHKKIFLNFCTVLHKFYSSDTSDENDEEVTNHTEFSDEEAAANYKSVLPKPKQNKSCHWSEKFATDMKSAHFEGGTARKDIQPPEPRVSPSTNQQLPSDPGSVLAPQVTTDGIYTVAATGSESSSFGNSCPLVVLQQTVVELLYPPQQPQNVRPSPKVVDATYPHQYQNQNLCTYPDPMLYQQQLQYFHPFGVAASEPWFTYTARNQTQFFYASKYNDSTPTLANPCACK